eukprot:scaffold2974_cov181-Amphora_coffeaeformis.AAC.14
MKDEGMEPFVESAQQLGGFPSNHVNQYTHHAIQYEGTFVAYTGCCGTPTSLVEFRILGHVAKLGPKPYQ